MEILKEISRQDIISNSLSTAMTYEEYHNLLNELSETYSTTGNNKSEALVEHTKMNARRVNRWEKTMKISYEHVKAINSINLDLEWIVLTESWCGDAAHVLPAIKKVADFNHKIDLKIALRDENEELMNNFLTNGSQSIPKLIAVDKRSKDVLFTYGPRPSNATKLVREFIANHGTLTSEFKEDLQRWYNKDKGQSTINDLTEILETL
jgi:hypothetical protein